MLLTVPDVAVVNVLFRISRHIRKAKNWRIYALAWSMKALATRPQFSRCDLISPRRARWGAAKNEDQAYGKSGKEQLILLHA